MADRNLNEPTDPGEQDSEIQYDDSDPTMSDASVDPQALPDEGLQIDEGAAAFREDEAEDIVGAADPDTVEMTSSEIQDAQVADDQDFGDNTFADQASEAGTGPVEEPVPAGDFPPADGPVPADTPREEMAPSQESAQPEDVAQDPVPTEDPAPVEEPVAEEPVQEQRDYTAIPHRVSMNDQEIPRDVLERRQSPEDDYERMRELPPEMQAQPADEPVEPAAEATEEEIDYSQWQEDADPETYPETSRTREEIHVDDARPAPLGDAGAAVGAGAVAGGVAGAAVTDDDDLETTKVRRQSLLNPPEEPQTDAEATSSWHPRETPQDETDVESSLFDDATVVPEVPSRVGARVWSFFLTLVGVPAAWYLITDAAARLTLAEGNPLATGSINPAALAELGAGVIVAIIVIMLTIRSSLGALIFGFLAMVAGGFFLFVPTMTANFMEPAYNWMIAFNDFGSNVAHHIQWTGYTGAMFVSGLMLFIIGLTSIFARRDGRREQDIRAQIERLAPGTLKKGRKKKA